MRQGSTNGGIFLGGLLRGVKPDEVIWSVSWLVGWPRRALIRWQLGVEVVVGLDLTEGGSWGWFRVHFGSAKG